MKSNCLSHPVIHDILTAKMLESDKKEEALIHLAMRDQAELSLASSPFLSH